MPLLDHFRPPLFPRRHRESFHTAWAGSIADVLNEQLLPEGYFAEEHTHLGPRVEIDITTFDDQQVWSPPVPAATLSAAFPDSFSVLVFQSEGGARFVATVELVSPANKDRTGKRRAFVAKCASYLARGIGLIVADVVTTRHANLHDEIMTLLEHNLPLTTESGLYAAAYRPIVRNGAEQLDV
jgi:hypothetical protein